MRRAATVIFYAPVAQLDRALDSDSKGRTFESCRAYQIKSRTNPIGSSGFCFMGGKLRLRFLERSQKKRGSRCGRSQKKGKLRCGRSRGKGELRCGRSQKKGICDAGAHGKRGFAMRALTEKGDRDAGAHGKRGFAMRALTEKGDLRCGRSDLAQSSSKTPV